MQDKFEKFHNKKPGFDDRFCSLYTPQKKSYRNNIKNNMKMSTIIGSTAVENNNELFFNNFFPRKSLAGIEFEEKGTFRKLNMDIPENNKKFSLK